MYYVITYEKTRCETELAWSAVGIANALAYDAMENGGQVTVMTCGSPSDRTWFTISYDEQADKYLICNTPVASHLEIYDVIVERLIRK